MRLKVLGCLMLALAAGGCDVYDNMNQEPAEDNRTRLIFQNAPPDSVLLINGETVGRAADFGDEASAFRLSQGNYVVDVWQASEHKLTSTVMATDGSVQTITVPMPAAENTAAQ
jgi:hypothetical protein